MVKSKKASTKRKVSNNKQSKTVERKTFQSIVGHPLAVSKKRINSFLKRRPHRSFRRTMRRDYERSLNLPGYVSFTNYVNKTLWSNRKTFVLLAILYALLTALMVGIASQENYTILTDTLRDTGGDIFEGNWGELGKASLLFATAMTGGLSQALTDVQQVYAGLIALLAWLTTVWLLRNIFAGHKVKLRDGLYSSGSPILSLAVVSLVLLVQLLPLALALIGYSAASATGLLAGGVEAMLFWAAAGGLALLSLYWVTSTFFALVIVTLPGMYPFKALRAAGDLVVGRRLRILLRLLWMIAAIILTWAIILIPVILLDTWLKGVWESIEWLPVIPTVLLLLSSISVIWVSSYVYLLYRKVVDDDAEPA